MNIQPKTNFNHNFIRHKNKRFFVLCFFLILLIPFSAYSQIGLLKSKPDCQIWWTGSTYKIGQEQSVPTLKRNIILRSAKNETESFQLVLSPSENMEDVSVSISDFLTNEGIKIPVENIIIRKVEYVKVTKPSGKLHKRGWYPDPLPLLNSSFNAPKNINTSVWFTVKVPANVASGKYKATIRLQALNWSTEIPVELDVWDFVLPENPYMRSGFGMSTTRIKQYHNLESKEELELVTDKYFNEFKAYKISPYHFDALSPIKRTVKGICWHGGTFDQENAFNGKYAYKISSGRKARFSDFIPINPTHPYLLKWQAKTLPTDKKYTVTVHCYDEDRKPIHYSMKWVIYEGSDNWRQDTMFIDPEEFFAYEDLPDYREFPENARYASLNLHAPEGGTVWFDDIQFLDKKENKNLLVDGNFEQDIDELDLELDFTDFDIAARKYLDGLGFSGFRFGVPGLGKTSLGELNGFVIGTAEHKKLVSLYLKGVQDHLEKNGWLGKEYLYWADEPKHEHYKFVRQGMDLIHEAAPKLKRFITENNPGPEIMDITEIGCPVFYKAEPEKIKKWKEKGRQFWSYLMCWPKEPHVNLFIDSDAINLRMWIWMSYKYNLEGILIWNINQWNGSNKGAAPEGYLQNIWEDPMTYKSGWGTPYGSAPEFGNGDGMLFYPPNRNPNNDKTKYMEGPVPSLRLEILRDGLDDYDYMRMLEECIEKMPEKKALVKKAKKLLGFGSDIFENDTTYTKDPEVLMKYRVQMGEVLEAFYDNKK